MKRTAAVLLLLTLVFSTGVTSFAQKSRPVRPPAVGTDFVGFQAINSYTDGQGVLIRWQMTFETRNLGFYIYRLTESGPQLVNQTIIGGYAMKSRYPTGYDQSYEHYDGGGATGSVYYIQALGGDGKRVSSSYFTPKVTDQFELVTGHPKSYYEEHAANTNGEVAQRNLKLPKTLQTTVNEALLPPDPETQRWVASQPAAKIAVKEDGMYRVTRTELQNAGFNVNSNSASWRLFQEGNEQAMIVGPGDQYIEFYGRSIDTVESDTRMYYLIADSVAGKRIDTRVLRNLGGTVVSTSYTEAAVRKQRFQYFSSVLNGDAQNYFGDLIANSVTPIPNPSPLPPQVYVPYVLTDIDRSMPTASVTVRLQGLPILRFEHEVQASLNGVALGTMNFTGSQNASATFSVSTDALIEGPNFFQFQATQGNDFSVFDTATINYGRAYRAVDNRLQFFTPGYRRANVTNFSSANVRVFDVTYDGNTQLLINFPVVAEGGTFTVRLPSDRSAVMYAVEDSGMLQSPSVTFNTPSTLSTTLNSADMVIISDSSSEFMTASQTWANYRHSAAGGGFNVRVVDVADVYDEFSYGVPSANAVRAFIEYAKTSWQAPTPSYVLLMGDASYDPRNYEGFGSWNMVPTRMVDLIYSESPSDDALTDFDHDGFANVAIGRIAARNSQDVMTALAKTGTFEGDPDLLARGAMCAADLPLGFDFEAMCLQLQNELPPGTPFHLVRRALPPPNPQNEPDPQAHANLLEALNRGPYIANYSGHGSVGTWAASSFFTNADVPFLTNAGNESIYTMLTCLSGYFVRPNGDALSEVLVSAPNGGGVAAWASTTETTPDLQLIMATRFYHGVGAGQLNRLGDVILDAKTVLPPGSDVGYSWGLIGDPALKMH